MASMSFRIQWSGHQKLLMFMNELPLMDGTSVLGILHSKLFITLLRIFLFPFHLKNSLHHYVILVPLIKFINNHFMALAFKVMHPLNLFTQMCGVQLVILELMVRDTISFLSTIIQNIYGSIQWQLNPVSLLFFHNSKSLSKLAFKNQSKHFILIMEVSLLH